MIDGTLILMGRRMTRSDRTIETHAERLRKRDVAETVRIKRYDDERGIIADGKGSAIKDEDYSGEDVFLLPMIVAETNAMTHAIRAVAAGTGSPIICDPIGRSPAVADIIADRASKRIEPAADTSLVLVGLGSSVLPHQHQTLRSHETRLRERTAYGEVRSCYLLQDPTVECLRYNVSNEQIVIVPVFFSSCVATAEEIPAKIDLDFDRSDIEYTEPIGTHPRITDAIHAEVARQHILKTAVSDLKPAAIEGLSTVSQNSAVTDGFGPSR